MKDSIKRIGCGVLLFLSLAGLAYAQTNDRSPIDVAILDLNLGEGIDRTKGEFIASEFREKLLQYGGHYYQILEREELERILEEQSLQLSGLVKDSDVTRIGDWRGVEQLVFGEVIATPGGNIKIQVRFVDVETTKNVLIQSVVAFAGDNSLKYAVDLLTRRICGVETTEESVSFQYKPIDLPTFTRSGQTTQIDAAWFEGRFKAANAGFNRGTRTKSLSSSRLRVCTPPGSQSLWPVRSGKLPAIPTGIS